MLARLKRQVSLAAAMAAAVAALSVAFWLAGSDDARGQGTNRPARMQRIVSLAPAITETLFAIGAGDLVAGVSAYCDFPPAATERPRAGSWLSPNYEVLAQLRPTLILTSAEVPGPLVPLRRIAPAEQLPWLSLEEMLSSIEQIGELSERQAQAKALKLRLSKELGRRPPPDAPSVLFTLAHQAGRLSEVWFLRDASIHGAVLRAAGGRNAVAEPIAGPPRLSLEQMIEVDPDMILVLARGDPGSDAARSGYIADFLALAPLRAARSGRIGVVQGPEVHVSGPRVLELVARVRREIDRLKEAR